MIICVDMVVDPKDTKKAIKEIREKFAKTLKSLKYATPTVSNERYMVSTWEHLE